MLKSPQSLVFLLAMCGASVAWSAPVGLGVAGQYNLVSFGDFNSHNTSVGGSVAVAGDLTATSMRVSGSNLVVGGDLRFHNGSIAGSAYVGGTRTTAGMSLGGQWLAGDTPLGFASLATALGSLSQGLAGMAASGSGQNQWGGLQLAGTNSAVEVFNLNAAQLGAANWNSKSRLAAGSTLIFNVGGASVNLSGGLFDGFGSYNVLLNFYEAQTITFSGMGIDASILAPGATVRGGNGQINGNVVVGDWQSSMTLLGARTFHTTDVAGYVLPEPIQPERPSTAPALAGVPDAALAAEVPEPSAMALMALALAALCLAARRRGRATLRA